jgi:transcription-repair coupling factor (superfamily II helicase)
VHNRVDSIERAAARLRELVPEARVAVGHGQMNEDALERVMIGFWEKEFDVLVSTTIVESGLEIPNANTLIVERSDHFGLSQLHQLRGRVGRGRERAYAYFLYPPEMPLTETALDRLQTIAANAELGAGMQVAMKDLEIRGAGNLLGGEQSGHIAGVGFDLYVRLVGEAVADFRGEAPQDEVADVKVDLPVNALLPHDYIPGERLRLEAYRALAAADSTRRWTRSATSWPTATARCRSRWRTCCRWPVPGVRPPVRRDEVSLQGSVVRFSPLSLRESQEMRMHRLYPRSVWKGSIGTISVPRPGKPGQPLRDVPLLAGPGPCSSTCSVEPEPAVAAGA